MKAGIRICIAALVTGLVILACSPNEQQQQRTLENSTPETVDLLVSLGGSSRAERFLGTFDEINKLTLDLKRNFDNKQVVSGFPLTRDDTSRWSGTINNLIISFDYTITGHAYKCTDCPEGASSSTSFDNFTVSTFAGSGTEGSDDGQGTTASFDIPSGVTADSSGNVYVADTGNNLIRKIDPLGNVTTLAGNGTDGSTDGQGTATSFKYPVDVAVDSSGNVYVADNNNHLIRKIDSLGNVTTLAGSGTQGSTDGQGTSASFNKPSGVAVDSSGNVYVAEFNNHLIRRIDSTGNVTTLAGSGTSGSVDGEGTAASFNKPMGVAVDSSGYVYVADRENHLIRKIDSLGNVTTLAGSGTSGSTDGQGTSASFNSPRGVAVDSSGNVYVAEFNSHLIRRIDSSGNVTTLAGSGSGGFADGDGTSASFNSPRGVAVDSSGNVYVADYSNHLIRKLTGIGSSTASSSSDNSTYLEIFRGDTQHTVTSGTNALSLRLTPLLDDRELSVPRITRINRPFQLEKTDNATIAVAVENSDLQALQYRFRSVDETTSLPLSEVEGGRFSPDKGTHEADNSSSYPDLATTYTAPDLISVQNLQVRVSNDLEIGVTASFKTYVTGPIDSQTTVNTNPVVETISGERTGDNELKWMVLVSDDDPFDTLVASWTYQDPETGATRTFDNSTYTDLNDGSRSDVGVGSISAVMQGYQDSDAGMLRVTICETNYTNHTGSCVHGQEGSTSVDLELVAGAYQQPIICDGDSCDGLQNSSTLSQLRSRGKLRCGVNTGLEGFSKADDSGNWSGFDVDLCRAVAVATLGDKNSVEFIPLSGGERFEAVDNGSVDMLSRNTTWSLLRDSSLGVNYAGINFYDGQGFIVRSSSQIETVEDLSGKTICVNGNSRLQNNIENYFSLIQVNVVIDNTSSNNEALEKYLNGNCDAYSTDSSALAAKKSEFADPANHKILNQLISKEPLGPVVSDDDPVWKDIVQWSLNTMIIAEELGVTSNNVSSHSSSDNSKIRKLLGLDGDFGEPLGLSTDFMYEIINQVGNYGEIYENNLGVNTSLGLNRGLNALWTEGGLLYSPPLGGPTSSNDDFQTNTLSEVKSRGKIICGVSTGIYGFSSQADNGSWIGFDVDYCRALAAAIFNDTSKVEYVSLTGNERFTALNDGTVDLLSRNSTWTMGRDTGLKLDWAGISFYDGQGFLIRKNLDIDNASQLAGKTICVQSDTTTEENLKSFFNDDFIQVSGAEAEYLNGDCEVLTTDASALISKRSGFQNPDDHIILDERISKEPLGPLVRQSDQQWANITRWTLNTLIIAEEKSINSSNVQELKNGNDDETRIILGTEGELGSYLGLSNDFAYRIIKHVGNYEEIFDRNLGSGSTLNMERGYNNTWLKGGLLYSPPFDFGTVIPVVEPGITVNVISDNTTEAGGTASFTVVLDSEPTASVNIPISSDNVSEGTVSPSSLTFSTSNWNSAQTVTVTGVDDSVVDDNATYNIVIGAATSSDSNYDGMDAGDVGINNSNDDLLLGGSIQGTPLSLSTAVTTLAGTAGTSGTTDATGTSARLNLPYGITTDGTNLYVADMSNHLIRKVVISSGVVTTLAGTAGTSGSTDATGTAARFNKPGGVTTDGTNLYVADYRNHTIRKVVISSGVVTTLAGTAGASGTTDATGTAVRFNNPFGITTDGTNLYVAGYRNHTIRKVVISSGVVTTLAGTAGTSGTTDATGTSAKFNYPIQITTDGTNLYVADYSNHTIRKVVTSTGVVTTLAGTAGTSGTTDATGTSAKFNYPSGITTDGTNLYVADYNHTIRKVVISSGVVTTLAGTTGTSGSTDATGTTASFDTPFGITTDGTNLYVSDQANHTIRKIE